MDMARYIIKNMVILVSIGLMAFPNVLLKRSTVALAAGQYGAMRNH